MLHHYEGLTGSIESKHGGIYNRICISTDNRFLAQPYSPLDPMKRYQVLAIDVNEEAIESGKEKAVLAGCNDRVTFKVVEPRSDLFLKLLMRCGPEPNRSVMQVQPVLIKDSTSFYSN